jgi:hypothetical protein
MLRRRSGAQLRPARVRAPATFRPGELEICLRRPKFHNAAEPLRSSCQRPYEPLVRPTNVRMNTHEYGTDA